MSNDLNILILSCGTRNKIVQYFKKELGSQGHVFVTDCSELAPALYEADKYFIVPRMNEKGYLDEILSICKEYNIKAVLSLIDPELSLLAKHRQEFLNIGTMPIISDEDAINLSFDKYKMFEFLVDNGFKTVNSYIFKEDFYKDIDAGVINYPVFVKPVRGSASINISKVSSKDEVELLFSRFDNLMIQEFMDGTEYGVDVYIDMISAEPVAMFIKEKIKMRAGETDKSVSINDQQLFKLVRELVEGTGFKGVIDIDIFKVNGEFFISEVNPRFGGGYPHAYESGVNIPKLILKNINHQINPVNIGDYQSGIMMMKFNEVKILINNFSSI